MWGPRISPDLAISIKKQLIRTVEHLNQLGESAGRLIQLFAVVCLEHPDLYKAKEQHDALVAAGIEGLENIAELFWRTVAGDTESVDNYWGNRIRPFMKRAWPKASEFVSDNTAEHLSLMAIALDDAFEDAVDFLWPFIKPFPNISFLLTHLAEKELPEKQPKVVFRLLSKVFMDEYQWPNGHQIPSAMY